MPEEPFNSKKFCRTFYAASVVTLIVSFVGSSLYIPSANAQVASDSQISWMPKPGVMVNLSPEFSPSQLNGISIHPDNALQFDFLINKGDEVLANDQKKEEYKKLVKYFLASLTIPDDDQWVNLSPYEKNRIIQDNFGKTQMGRDLLAEDYMLKQITASLIYPEKGLGKKFWDKIYQRSWDEYHTTDIPVNTFNKVWIVPDEAMMYESGNTAYIMRSHLKVMLEQDYLSLSKHTAITNPQPTKAKEVNKIGSQVVREIVLPALEQEVNEGKNFALLRQMYSGMILATWYKKDLRESLLGKVYADKAKVKGVDQDPRSNEVIYQRYLRAFKKGVFNYIKEDTDKYTNETIPRKYFSGGFERDKAMLIDYKDSKNTEMFPSGLPVGAIVVIKPSDLPNMPADEREKVLAALKPVEEIVEVQFDPSTGNHIILPNTSGETSKDEAMTTIHTNYGDATITYQLNGEYPLDKIIINFENTVHELRVSIPHGEYAFSAVRENMLGVGGKRQLEAFIANMINQNKQNGEVEIINGEQVKNKLIELVLSNQSPTRTIPTNYGDASISYELNGVYPLDKISIYFGNTGHEVRVSMQYGEHAVSGVREDMLGLEGKYELEGFIADMINQNNQIDAGKIRDKLVAIVMSNQVAIAKSAMTDFTRVSILPLDGYIGGTRTTYSARPLTETEQVTALRLFGNIVRMPAISMLMGEELIRAVDEQLLQMTDENEYVRGAVHLEIVDAVRNGFLKGRSLSSPLISEDEWSVGALRQKLFGDAKLIDYVSVSKGREKTPFYVPGIRESQETEPLPTSTVEVNPAVLKYLGRDRRSLDNLLAFSFYYSKSRTAVTVIGGATALVAFYNHYILLGFLATGITLSQVINAQTIAQRVRLWNDSVRSFINRNVRFTPTANKDMGDSTKFYGHGKVDISKIKENDPQQKGPEDADKAMKGGIDFNAANLAMTIKRDGKGVPLPLAQQDMAQLSHIQGFDPVILEIRSAVNVPIVSELQQKLGGV